MIMKKIILGAVIIIIIAGGIYFVSRKSEIKENQTEANIQSSLNQNNSAFEIQNMKIEVLKQGTGPEAKNGDTVSANYTGTLEDGTKFDSSYDRGQPFSFTLGGGEVIKGWDLGILGMKVGEKRKLTIPYDLAYGEAGRPPVIPPKAVLIFEVELMGIK